MARFAISSLILAAPCALILCGQADSQPYGGYGGYPVDNRASTVGESYARGMADMTRSQGFANYANSEAAINMTQATSNHIQNRQQATTAYFSMREENRQARAAERGPRPTSEQLLRFAQAGVPKSLDTAQLNPSDGQIHWPRALRQEPFAVDRNQLEQISARRAAAGNKISDPDYYKSQELIKEMEKQLKDQITDIAPQEYMDCKRFLQSLSYEWQST